MAANVLLRCVMTGTHHGSGIKLAARATAGTVRAAAHAADGLLNVLTQRTAAEAPNTVASSQALARTMPAFDLQRAARAPPINPFIGTRQD